MTTAIEFYPGTTTQIATFEVDEINPFVDIILGCEIFFENDSIGDAFSVQVDDKELHIQIHAPESRTCFDELMMMGNFRRQQELSDKTVDERFAEIVERFAEHVDVRKKIADLASPVVALSDVRVESIQFLSEDDKKDISRSKLVFAMMIDDKYDEITRFKN